MRFSLIHTMRSAILAIIFILIITYPFSVSLKVLDDVWYTHPYIDEMFWIPASNIAFQDFFITHDFSKETWDQAYYSWGNYNPTIGKFIMGIVNGEHFRLRKERKNLPLRFPSPLLKRF